MKYLIKYGGLDISKNKEQNNDSKNENLFNIIESNEFNPENGNSLLDTFYNLKKIFIENKKFGNKFDYNYDLTQKDITSIINNITDFNYIDIYKKIVIFKYETNNYEIKEIDNESVINSLIGKNLKKGIIKFFINYIYWEIDDISSKSENYDPLMFKSNSEKKKYFNEFNKYFNLDNRNTDMQLIKDKIQIINNQIGSGNRVKKKVGKNDKQERADKIITFRDQLFEINIKDFFNSEIEMISNERKINLIKIFQETNHKNDLPNINNLVKEYLGISDYKNNYANDFLKKIELYFDIKKEPGQEDLIDYPIIKDKIFNDNFKININNLEITFKEYKKNLNEFKKYERLFEMIYILILNYYYNDVDSIYIFNIIKYLGKKNNLNLFDILYLFKDDIFIQNFRLLENEDYKQIIYFVLDEFKKAKESEQIIIAPEQTRITTLEQIQAPISTIAKVEQIQAPISTIAKVEQIQAPISTITKVEQTQTSTFLSNNDDQNLKYLNQLGEIFSNNISYKLFLLEINNFFENIREFKIENNKKDNINLKIDKLSDFFKEKKNSDLINNFEDFRKFINVVNRYKFFKFNNDEIYYYVYYKLFFKKKEIKETEYKIHNFIKELIDENNDDSIIKDNLYIKYNLSENKFNNFQMHEEDVNKSLESIYSIFKNNYRNLVRDTEDIIPRMLEYLNSFKRMKDHENYRDNLKYWPYAHLFKYDGNLNDINVKINDLLTKNKKKKIKNDLEAIELMYKGNKILNYFVMIQDIFNDYFSLKNDEEINFYLIYRNNSLQNDRENKIGIDLDTELDELKFIEILMYNNDLQANPSQDKINLRFKQLISALYTLSNKKIFKEVTTTIPVNSTQTGSTLAFTSFQKEENEELSILENTHFKIIFILYYYISFYDLNLLIKYLLDNNELTLIFRIFNTFENVSKSHQITSLKDQIEKNCLTEYGKKLAELESKFLNIFQDKFFKLDDNNNLISDYLINNIDLFRKLERLDYTQRLLVISFTKSIILNYNSDLNNDIDSFLDNINNFNKQNINSEKNTEYFNNLHDILFDQKFRKINFLFLNYDMVDSLAGTNDLENRVEKSYLIFLQRKFFYKINLIYKNSFFFLNLFYSRLFNKNLSLFFNYDFIFENLNKLKVYNDWVNNIKILISTKLPKIITDEKKKKKFLDYDIYTIFLIFLGLDHNVKFVYQHIDINNLEKDMANYQVGFDGNDEKHQKKLLIKCFNIYYFKFNKKLFRLLNPRFNFDKFKTNIENFDLNYDDFNFFLNQKNELSKDLFSYQKNIELGKKKELGKEKESSKEEELSDDDSDDDSEEELKVEEFGEEELNEEELSEGKVIYLNYKNKFYKIFYKENYLKINYIIYEDENIKTKVIQTIDISNKYNYGNFKINDNSKSILKEYYIRDEEIDYNNHIDYICENNDNIIYGSKHNDIEDELFYFNDYYKNKSKQNSGKKNSKKNSDKKNESEQNIDKKNESEQNIDKKNESEQNSDKKNESEQNSNKKYNNLIYLSKNYKELFGKGFLNFRNCKFFGNYKFDSKNNFWFDGYFYEIRDRNNNRMMVEKVNKEQIDLFIKNFNIFYKIPYIDIDLKSENISKDIKKIPENDEIDMKLISLIILSLKIRIKQSSFNKIEDFEKYLTDLGLSKFNRKIVQFLLRKYNIRILLEKREKNNDQKKKEDLIKTYNDNDKNITNKIIKLFDDQEFHNKHKKLYKFKDMIIKNFLDNRKYYDEIVVNILLKKKKNIKILDCMNIFRNHNYTETIKNILTFKSLSDDEKIIKLKEYEINIDEQTIPENSLNIEIDEQTIPQNSLNIEIDEQTELENSLNIEIDEQTIPENSLIIYVYQGSNFDHHIYYEWEKNSLWIEVSCMHNEENCNETFLKNPMDDFFIIYFCSKFIEFIKSPINNSNLIIYSNDNFSEWNIEKNDNVNIIKYKKPNEKKIIKKNLHTPYKDIVNKITKNLHTPFRDMVIRNTNILDDIKELFIKLKKIENILDDKELKLIIDNYILFNLKAINEYDEYKYYKFIETNNEYNIEQSDISGSSSGIDNSSRNFYIDRIVEQYYMVLDRAHSEEIFIIFLNHIKDNEKLYKLNFPEIYNQFDIIYPRVFPQEGWGKIYKISYNI